MTAPVSLHLHADLVSGGKPVEHRHEVSGRGWLRHQHDGMGAAFSHDVCPLQGVSACPAESGRYCVVHDEPRSAVCRHCGESITDEVPDDGSAWADAEWIHDGGEVLCLDGGGEAAPEPIPASAPCDHAVNSDCPHYDLGAGEG